MLCTLFLYIVFAKSTENNSEAYQNQLFSYFVDNVTVNGLILDRASDRTKVSVAANGFAMYVYALASSEGQISRSEALSKIRQIFRTTLKNNPKKNRGFLWHFITQDGLPVCSSEVSTMDTSLFYLGALRASEHLECEDLIKEIQVAIATVDKNWMIDPKTGFFRHGLFWEGEGETPRFIDCVWDQLSEGVLIYKLFNIPYKPTVSRHDLSLFTYYYPLCFFDEPIMIENLKKAVAFQQEKYKYFGITASDTQFNGYQDFDPQTISPLAIYTLNNYLGISNPILTFPAKIPQAKNILTNWESPDKLGIESGSAYILNWKAKTKINKN